MQHVRDKLGTPDDGDPLPDQLVHQLGARLIQEGDRTKIEMYLFRLMGRFGAESPQFIHPGSEDLSFELEGYGCIAPRYFGNLEHVAVLLGRTPPKAIGVPFGTSTDENGRNRLSAHDLRFERINDDVARRALSDQ
jgi:hypothetical protein